MNKGQLLAGITGGLCALGVAGSVNAAFIDGIISVDFNAWGEHASGAAVIGQDGDQWNIITSSNAALVDTQGDSTGAVVSYSSGGNYSQAGYTGLNRPLMMDYIFANSGIGTITLGGLDSDTTYDIYLYSGNNSHAYTMDVTVAGALTLEKQIVNPIGEQTSYILGLNYDRYQLAPDDEGQITIQFSDATATSTEVVVNGLQITAVPEPASLGVLGLGGLLLLRRRRAAGRRA